ncbi:D-amino-acid dehydrogenase [Andreprevotia lacus DSM 23236]|jgi:D-amino-acid dehydrogenase|uniref:D-amino acid dehydrogenase n=1 Tax=Andreprevotia lacus DSM 23236 TaxID=1121001 RepID=A0A1W1XT40_9NEIS|nr:D-amino acid dehydrogenase [Andreprevotia lacus]SMC26698.1 D-amino-acid dehydrogenase [Andreprevotia lacus DSM 23236]
MHVVIIGAGVVGVTTAHYLRSAGHQVTVLEKLPGAAEETSFGNAGQVSPGYAAPWAAPGVPWKAVKWLVSEHAPLRIRPDGSWFQLAWMARMLMNCSEAAFERNKRRMVPLAEYSRDKLRELRRDLGLHYEERALGTLQLLRTEKQMFAAERDAAILDQLGVPHELLDTDELAAKEPALERVAHKLVGGLHLPNDETGDCKLFTERLAARLVQQGVTFRYGVTVEQIVTRNHQLRAVVLNDGEPVYADAVVIAGGCASRAIAAPLGLDLPVYPVKGYSLTIPLRDPASAPVSTVLDETYKIALTRFDNRLRVGGMAELVGYNRQLDPKRIETLKMVTHDLFPDAADTAQASAWTGLRPMTPDGTPLVCATDIRGVFLNTGHGTLGWTMACGSAKVVADLVSGLKPEIETSGLSLDRYHSQPQAEAPRHGGVRPAHV